MFGKIFCFSPLFVKKQDTSFVGAQESFLKLQVERRGRKKMAIDALIVGGYFVLQVVVVVQAQGQYNATHTKFYAFA